MNEDRPGYEPEPSHEAVPTAGHAPGLGPLARLGRLFTAPAEVFADIAVRPGWALPLGLLVAVSFASTAYITGKIDMAKTMDRWQQESGVVLDEEQLGDMAAREPNPLVRAAASAVITPLGMLLLGGVYLVTAKALGSGADFPTTFSVTVHSYLPGSLVKTGLMCALLVRRNAIAAQDLETLVASNLAAFLPPSAPPWVRTVAGTLDLFNVWTVILLTLGLAATGRLSRGRAAAAALIPWGVWIAIKGAGVAAFTALVRR